MFSAPSGGGQNEDSLTRGIILVFTIYFSSIFSTDLRENHKVTLPASFAFLGELVHRLQHHAE